MKKEKTRNLAKNRKKFEKHKKKVLNKMKEKIQKKTEVREILQQEIIMSIVYNKKYTLCLSVWVSDCLYPINVKTAEQIGPKFFEGLHKSPGRYVDDQNI